MATAFEQEFELHQIQLLKIIRKHSNPVSGCSQAKLEEAWGRLHPPHPSPLDCAEKYGVPYRDPLSSIITRGHVFTCTPNGEYGIKGRNLKLTPEGEAAIKDWNIRNPGDIKSEPATSEFDKLPPGANRTENRHSNRRGGKFAKAAPPSLRDQVNADLETQHAGPQDRGGDGPDDI